MGYMRNGAGSPARKAKMLRNFGEAHYAPGDKVYLQSDCIPDTDYHTAVREAIVLCDYGPELQSDHGNTYMTYDVKVYMVDTDEVLTVYFGNLQTDTALADLSTLPTDMVIAWYLTAECSN